MSARRPCRRPAAAVGTCRARRQTDRHARHRASKRHAASHRGLLRLPVHCQRFSRRGFRFFPLSRTEPPPPEPPAIPQIESVAAATGAPTRYRETLERRGQPGHSRVLDHRTLRGRIGTRWSLFHARFHGPADCPAEFGTEDARDPSRSLACGFGIEPSFMLPPGCRRW